MTKARDIASAAPAPSTVSATELGYLDGVSSAIQTQLDAKTAKSTLTTTGDIYYASSANTPARLGIGSTGNVLTVASGIPSWAAPAGGTYSGVRVTRSANQSIPNATETILTWDVETFDEGLYHSTATNTGRLTVPVGKAGYYNIYFAQQWDVNATGDRGVSLYINGTSTGICGASALGDATDYPFCNGSTTYYLAEGDYVQLTGYQDRGGALNATNSPRVSFGMDKVG